MRAPSISTALRLGRITALVLACLLFLHACDQTRRLLPTAVWLELAAAAVLAAAAMIAAWFEIVRAERIEEVEELEANDPPAPRADDLLYDTSTHAIRARIARSGNLVIHGREHRGPHPGHEWSWTFRTDTFPAVRNALGSDGSGDGRDVLELLEEVVPRLDADSRADPGAWLRAHGIAGIYREKGDHPSRTTHKLPILRPGQRRAADARTRPSRAESGGGPSASEPARRGSRRPASSAAVASESRDARSRPNRRVDADRGPSSRRRSAESTPDSGPIRTGNGAIPTSKGIPKPRPGAHSGPLPTARPADSGPLPTSAQQPYAFRDSAGQHSGPIARAAKRRATGSRDSDLPPDHSSPPRADSGASPRRQRADRDTTDSAARPDLPRRGRQRAAADDLPETSIHGTRGASAVEPPGPGLFSARTGIDPADASWTPTSRSRTRPSRPGPSPAADFPSARIQASPGNAAFSGDTAYGGYDRASDEEPPDPTPGQPRRRGHRYR